jgi:hypothetical protein
MAIINPKGLTGTHLGILLPKGGKNEVGGEFDPINAGLKPLKTAG